MHFVLCTKQCNKIEGVILNRACIKGFFCPKHDGSGLKHSAAHLYQNIGRVPPTHCENREAPEKKRNLWNEKDYVTGISHEQKVTNNKITVRYNNFSEVLHAEQSFAGS